MEWVNVWVLQILPLSISFEIIKRIKESIKILKLS